MITYTWKITGLKTKDIDEERSGFIVQTYWKKIGTDEDGNVGEFAGATPFTPDPNDDSGPFKPLAELTEQDVIDWVKTVVVGEYEVHVNRQIQHQIDSNKKPLVEVDLPWAK